VTAGLGVAACALNDRPSVTVTGLAKRVGCLTLAGRRNPLICWATRRT
jgi:hypothetical protein